MIDNIIQWDQSLFLYLNGLHTNFLDPTMRFLSNSYIPGLVILLFLIIYGFKKFHKGVGLVFIFAILTVALSDSISSRIFKPSFKRLRPCYEKTIRPQVYSAGKSCWGGKYGFVSSHAANTFAIAMFTFMIFLSFTKKTFILFIWAALVSYSRIYLGKHYPLDLLCGGLLGIIIAFGTSKLFALSLLKLGLSSQDQ